MTFLIETLLAIGFGLGIALMIIGLSILYRVFISSENYQRPVVILGMAFLFIWMGASLLFGIFV